jgi:class 3 adenylate cyclase
METAPPEPTLSGARPLKPRGQSGQLFWKYLRVLVFLVSGGLLTSSVFGLYSALQTQAELRQLQRKAVDEAADRVGQFLADTVEQVVWTVGPVAARAVPPEERRDAYRRLLRLAPAITRVSYRDCEGVERLVVSRITVDLVGPAAASCGFDRVAGGDHRQVRFGEVELDRGYPHVDLVVDEGPSGGRTLARVNLTYAGDVVARVKVGPNACAYLLAGDGTLIAHPDPDLVRARPSLPVDERACSGVGPGARSVHVGPERELAEQLHAMLHGGRLFRAQQSIEPSKVQGVELQSLGWTAALEQPAEAALAPLLASLRNTLALLLLGLLVSAVASRALAGRMVAPIRALQRGAERIGAGDLGHRIIVNTGDELHSLADSFNRMGEQLQRGRELDEQNRRLRGFLAPQVVEQIVASGDESVLESHRGQVTVFFCDLRGYTAFVNSVEPEDLMGVLREYHAVLGELVHRYEGTLERFTGDGLMVFFNDPVPQPDHAERAVRMALEMRERVDELSRHWRERGYDLGFGIGIAMGDATLGRIGFEGRSDYAAIGRTTNLAARLCSEAADSQVLVSQRVRDALDGQVSAASVGELILKGFSHPVQVFEVLGIA